MTSVTSLLAQLRASGVVIRSEKGRLIVEGPAGAVTADLRAQLALNKAELITALTADPVQGTCTAEAVDVVAALLALAYKRYARVQRVGSEQSHDPTDVALAISHGQSVHGVVQ